VEVRKITVPGQPGVKIQETPISTNKKLGMVAHACHPSYLGSKNRRLEIQASLGIKVGSYSNNNNNKKKRAWDMAQVIECLLSKCKTLSSNLHIKKKKFGYYYP
jgi:hypothetical protein